ncbi:putative GPI-anchored cupredoxin [Lachnellula arida]|uniref:Putative GPI-anchored cupredoxin n=1 Tax=Lachnellula arida TaxID=1316785 RepID=A0A8T9AXP7_9HELO|nr:putative GPI-anchored cupredoxin [Lachnellula arida]
MKVSGISALSGILGVASANTCSSITVTASGSCTTSSYGGSSYGNKTVTVTSTVTAPASYASNYKGAISIGSPGDTMVSAGSPKSYIPASSTYIGPPLTYVGSSKSGAVAPPYVVTSDTVVTSVDYGYKETSVWIYPTGSSSNKECTVAIYKETTVTVVVININITIINGQAATICSTVNGKTPTTTPTIPPPTTYSQPPSSTSTSSSGGGSNSTKVHNVVVGAEGKLLYKDNQIIACIGDIIRFDFNSTNHTVTQSTLQMPCKPLKDGFDTGFTHFNDKNRTGVLPPVDFTVTVSTPLWFYCAQPKRTHCQKGMVLGINPGNKFPEFLGAATASTTATASTGFPKSSGGFRSGTGKTASSSPISFASKFSAMSRSD